MVFFYSHLLIKHYIQLVDNKTPKTLKKSHLFLIFGKEFTK